MAFHHMVFHPALLTHRAGHKGRIPEKQDNTELKRSKFGKPVFIWGGKGLTVRKVGEGKGKTIHVLLFGLLSDRFLGLLHGFKQMIAVSSLLLFLLWGPPSSRIIRKLFFVRPLKVDVASGVVLIRGAGHKGTQTCDDQVALISMYK